MCSTWTNTALSTRLKWIQWTDLIITTFLRGLSGFCHHEVIVYWEDAVALQLKSIMNPREPLILLLKDFYFTLEMLVCESSARMMQLWVSSLSIWYHYEKSSKEDVLKIKHDIHFTKVRTFVPAFASLHVPPRSRTSRRSWVMLLNPWVRELQPPTLKLSSNMRTYSSPAARGVPHINASFNI